MHKAKYILYIVAILSIFLMFSGDSTFADNVDYSVNVAPSLKLTIPDSSLVLNLNPPSKTFDSKDLTVTVGTNNATGYKLTLSTPNDNTDLERDTSGDTTAISATIPTLDTGTYTESTFTANKWGYKINSNTAIPSTVTSGFIPFVSGNTLMERDTAVNQDQTELSFASKIDYLQPAGAYNTTLQFNIVANPLVNYMQDLNPALCTTTPMTVVDKRDDQEYLIQRLADGNCWMITNLNLGAVELATDLTPNNTNLSTPISASSFNSWKNGSGSGEERYVVVSGIDSVSQTPNGVLYNFCAASGSTRCGSTTAKATDDICPAGWRLPTSVGTSSEYTRLYNQYGSYANMTKPIANGGAAFARPGYSPSGTSITSSGTYGFYWSSEHTSVTTVWGGLYLSPDGTVYPDNYIGRGSGTSIRCILNDPRTISDITAMQEMNPQIAAKMNNGDTATLKDSRDGQDYTVAKINGNVWMTRNLAIGCNGTGSTYGGAITPIGLTPANTNITSSWTTPTDSLELGDSYDDPRMFCDTTYGAWYNYAATSAGTITGNSNTTTTTSDICPAGWRLASNTEFSSITGYVSAFNPAVGGGWDTGHVSSQHVGVYTSSIAGSAIYRYYLFYDGSSLSVNYSSSERFKGYYVRCIAK